MYDSEFARVFGVDFYSVISRGSQFKVESFLFRIAKPENFVLVSPSKQDVRRALHRGILQSIILTGGISGRETKCCRMYASDHGTSLRIL
jgi:DNA polymerase elongation subunit (family B)